MLAYPKNRTRLFYAVLSPPSTAMGLFNLSVVPPQLTVSLGVALAWTRLRHDAPHDESHGHGP